MKKFFALAFCALAITGTALAEGGSATATIEGTIEYPAQISAERNIDFGLIYRTDVPQDIEIDAVGQTARFYITGDVGDLVNIFYDDAVTLYGDHATVTAMTAANEEHEYQGDINTNEMTFTTRAYYRFVTEDEAHRVLWFLPTWLAGDDYCDIQDGTEWCISEELDPGVGQINLFVGGTLHVTDDQQRGNYMGEINASVAYF
jgi:hypothetical protein